MNSSKEGIQLPISPKFIQPASQLGIFSFWYIQLWMILLWLATQKSTCILIYVQFSCMQLMIPFSQRCLMDNAMACSQAKLWVMLGSQSFSGLCWPNFCKTGGPMGHAQNKQSFLAEKTKSDHKLSKTFYFIKILASQVARYILRANV